MIVDGKVAAGSQYNEGGCLFVSPYWHHNAAMVAEAAAQEWSPHPVFVIDVARVGNDYKVIEIGPFNYAGLYQCDLREVVLTINKHLERTYE